MKKTVLVYLASILIGTTLSIAFIMPNHDNFTLNYQDYFANTEGRRVLSEETAKIDKDAVCTEIDGTLEEGQIVTNDQRESWKSNQETLKSARGDKNPLGDYLKGDEEITPFIVSVLMYAGLFLVFTVLSLIGYVCYAICCVCEKCCPPCKLCCKKCKKEDAYTGFSYYWPAAGSLFLMLWIFITCIIGLTYASGIENSFHTMMCWAANAMFGLNYGGGSFKGVGGIQKSLTDYADNDLGQVITQTGNTFQGMPEWTSKEKDELDVISAAMKVPCDPSSPTTCYQCTGQTYVGTKPASIVTVCDAADYTPYASVQSFDYTNSPVSGGATAASIFFTQAIWGEQVDATKTLYEGTIQGITAAIQGIETAGGNINDQSATMQQVVRDGATSMKTIQDNLDTQIKDIATFHSDFKGYLALFTSGLTTLLWLFIWMAVFTIVFMVLIFAKKMYFLRVALHVFWCLFSLLMIFTFLFATLFMVIAISGEQMCDVMDNMFNDRVEFNSYTNLLGKDTADKIQICKKELNPVDGPYGGDDNLAKAFGIDEQLKDIDTLKTEILNFQNEAGTDSANMQQLRTIPSNIDVLVTNLNTLKNTQGFSGQDDHAQLDTAMTTLNTNLDDAGGCNIPSDEVVKDKDTCTNTYISYADAGTTVGTDCFWINDALGSSTRYDAVQCSSTVKANLQQIQTWVTDKNQICDLKIVQTTDLKDQLTQFINLQEAYIASVTAFTDSVLTALDKIAGENGLLNSIKCFWFGEQLDLLYDALCVSFVSSVYNLAFVSGFFSFGLYFGSFFLFMTARRVAHNKNMESKQKKIDGMDLPKDSYAIPE